jgi:4-alpha-glucanotransferase
MGKRGSGILLHISSLPSAYGIGDLGPRAYDFVDLLRDAGQSFWQVLPLNPTELAQANSPYSSISAFAGNQLMISPDFLVKNKLIKKKDLEPVPSFSQHEVIYPDVIKYKIRVLEKAYKTFKAKSKNDSYKEFCLEHNDWLEDYALFVALKSENNGKPWCDWDIRLRDRDREAVKEAAVRLKDKIEKEKFYQYIFYRQWHSLKKYCNEKGIQVIGDIPVYVTYDSVDVWKSPEIFKLDNQKKPLSVAGVPPDYFSRTGQLWGNPVYNWHAFKKTQYAWWISRIEHCLKLYDIIRIDHFRGLVAYWEIPSVEKTATNGKWVEVPVEDFLDTLYRRFYNLPLIAEDLGFITPDVREIIARYKLPGMKILLFAFGENNPKHPYLPHNFTKNCVVYTGTHDNNTIRGWFEKEATPDDISRLEQYIGYAVSTDNVNWALIRLAMMSMADIAIVPMQDILGLGESARMNKPSVASGNWQWRFEEELFTAEIKERLLRLAKIYGRA